MRNELPKKIKEIECGIINLDDNEGTHWTGYCKRGNNVVYFDSYGNLKPPLELVNYFKSRGNNISIKYNYDRLQNYNSHNCGHLTLQFIHNLMCE